MDAPLTSILIAAITAALAFSGTRGFAEESAPEVAQVEIETRLIEVTPAAVRSSPTLREWFPMSPRAQAPPVRTFDAWADLVAALNQQRGVDLLCAPRVTTRLGQKATIEVIREITYATEWTPAEKGQLPVPKHQQKAEVGFRLTIVPTKGADGTIELNVQASSVEFLGYLDHSRGRTRLVDAPVGNQSALIRPLPTVMRPASDGSALQPLLDSREISTTVTLHDGAMAALGCPDTAPELRRYQSVPRKKMVLVSAKFLKN